jgi:hypothetical protein
MFSSNSVMDGSLKFRSVDECWAMIQLVTHAPLTISMSIHVHGSMVHFDIDLARANPAGLRHMRAHWQSDIIDVAMRPANFLQATRSSEVPGN